jgi:hypothetical protein
MNRTIKVKICSVCGITSEEIRHMLTGNNKFNMELCNRHYRQLCREGKITNPEKPPIRSSHELNEYILYDDYAEVCLYNTKSEEVARAKIDIENITICKQYKWRLKNDGYVVTTTKTNELPRKTTKYIHRWIMSEPDSKVIDHINHDKLDNRKCNLRVCTQTENSQNKQLTDRNKSGCLGVSWSKVMNKWYARINVNGENVYLGYFTNKEDAIKVRKEAEQKYFGEFAPK